MRSLKNTLITFIAVFALFFGMKAEVTLAITTVRILEGSTVGQAMINSSNKNTIIAAASEQIAKNIQWLVTKERDLDPAAWGMNKKAQQELTAQGLKWMGGQQPGQNGQIPFVQNYSAHNANVTVNVSGDFIFVGNTFNDAAQQCSEEDTFEVRTAVLQAYIKDFGNDTQRNHCEDESNDDRHPFERIFQNNAGCRGETCTAMRLNKELRLRIVDAQINEARAVDNGRGFIPQRVCRVINDPDGRPRQLCEIVNPPSLAADYASFSTIELPGLSLLNVDEFDEVISNFI